MNLKTITILIIISSLFWSTCALKRKTQFKDYIELNTMWAIDSCGSKGYRSAIVDFVFQEKQMNFIGYKAKDVLSLFPKPNLVENSEELDKVVYTYIVEGYADCNLPNKTVLKTMIIEANLKNNLIEKAQWFIH